MRFVTAVFPLGKPLMEPFRACLAVLPLAVYLLTIGIINLGGRPFLTTGARDGYALGLALAGFCIIGPIELFMPEAAVAQFGPFVWLLLIAFYFLAVTSVILWMRPRIVIYNIALEELRPVLGKLVSELDPEHRWAGNSVVLPSLGVQFQIERFAPMRNVSLVAAATEQSYAGWHTLERRLAGELTATRRAPNPLGALFVSLAVLLLVAVGIWIAADPQAIVRGLVNWLQLT